VKLVALLIRQTALWRQDIFRVAAGKPQVFRGAMQSGTLTGGGR
jgi:hypothetical protein